MKFVSYRFQNRDRYGAVSGDSIVDLSERHGGEWPDLAAAIAAGGLSRLADAAGAESPGPTFADVELLPPITSPRKIICIGLNYRTHIQETGRDTPTHPMLFVRFPDTLVGHGQPMLRPRVSKNYDFEGELAVIIGRTARNVATERALDYVAGYSCFNDGSVRDYQRHTSQFTAGKNFWRSGAFGPWLVSADEIGDVGTLTLTTRLNGEIMQQAVTSDLLFGVGHLISFISSITPLDPGDVIATGTTGGIGAARKPPLWMKPGDLIEVEISRIGTLRNSIADEEQDPTTASRSGGK